MRGEEAWDKIVVNSQHLGLHKQSMKMDLQPFCNRNQCKEVHEAYTSMYVHVLRDVGYLQICHVSHLCIRQPALPSTIACPAAICSRPCCVLAKPTCPETDTCARLMRRFQPKCYKQMYTAHFRYHANRFQSVLSSLLALSGGNPKNKNPSFPTFLSVTSFGPPFVSSVCQQSAPHRATCVTHAVRCLQVVVPVDGHCGQNVIQLRHRGQSHGGGFCNQDRSTKIED